MPKTKPVVGRPRGADDDVFDDGDTARVADLSYESGHEDGYQHAVEKIVSLLNERAHAALANRDRSRESGRADSRRRKFQAQAEALFSAVTAIEKGMKG